ncbi:tetratricopeptide repeat protein [Arcicella aquatica]|uniref:Tetratricopeptide repeat protein n=1 Tax=Arcicella aquatica TaxID=217141 RepID=A0ABU5QKN7_9BACT|nr:tetratricopeptide repeat protein [Arcicella aquatica]MEA5257335.1 tetratricopeptide repeat protein [Arcicella aquatica]
MKRLTSLVISTLLFSFFAFNTAVLAQSTLSYSDISVHFRNGQEHFESKNYEACRAELTQYLEADRTFLEKEDANKVWAEYYLVKCSLYLNYSDTELLANRFVRNYPEHPIAGTLFTEIGNYFYEQGDYTRAIDYLSKSPKSNEEAQFRLGISHFTLQNYNEALVIFDSIKGGQGQYAPSASYYAGVINFRAKKYEEAIFDFKQAELSTSYFSEIPSWLAHSYYRQGKFTEMLAYTEPLLKEKNSGKKLDDVALLSAEVYFQQAEYAKAANYYTIYKNYKSQGMPITIAYRYGYSLYKTDQFAPASEQLKNVAAKGDTLGQYAAYILGICYLKANNPNYALGAFDQARKTNFNKTVTEDADFNYGKVLLDLQRGAESIKAFESFLAKYPNSKYEDEANELVSEAYLYSNNYQAALAYIEGLKKRTPRTNAAYQRISFNQAVKFYNDERYAEALPYFEKSLLTPENLETKYAANFWKAEALSAEKRYAEAIPLYQSLIATSDPSVSSLAELQSKSKYSLAYCYYNNKEYDKANKVFKDYADQMKSSGDSQSYQDALIRLGDTYFASKNYDQAIYYYDQAITGNRSDRDYATFQKGLVLALKGNEAGAKAAFQKVQTDYPQSLYFDNALYQEANLEFVAGRYIPAITRFTQLINNKPQSRLIPNALLKRAAAFANTANHEASILDYKSILKNFPTLSQSKDALTGVQEELNEVGRPEEFSAILADYQRTNPTDNSVVGLEYETAKRLFYADKFDKAIIALSEYVRKNPTSVESYEAKYLIAESYYKLNDKYQALNFYYQVIADNKYKSVNKAYVKAAELEFNGNNFSRAITNYRNILRFVGDKKDQQAALIGLMESYYKMSRADSTLYYANEVANTPDLVLGAKSKARLYTGKIYMDRNDFVKATEYFNQTIQIAKDNYGAEAQYLIAKILYTQRKYKESSEMIISKFRTDFADAADNIVGKAYLLLSDDFVGLDNIVQARATLNSIIENLPDQTIVAEAKVKLKAIEKR